MENNMTIRYQIGAEGVNQTSWGMLMYGDVAWAVRPLYVKRGNDGFGNESGPYGEVRFEVSGMSTMAEALYGGLSGRRLLNYLLQLSDVIMEAEEYLISLDSIIWNFDSIYIDANDRIKLIVYPLAAASTYQIMPRQIISSLISSVALDSLFSEENCMKLRRQLEGGEFNVTRFRDEIFEMSQNLERKSVRASEEAPKKGIGLFAGKREPRAKENNKEKAEKKTAKDNKKGFSLFHKKEQEQDYVDVAPHKMAQDYSSVTPRNKEQQGASEISEIPDIFKTESTVRGRNSGGNSSGNYGGNSGGNSSKNSGSTPDGDNSGYSETTVLCS